MPVICVSARTGVGLPELLDALVLCSLPPDRIARHAKTEAGAEVAVKVDPAGRWWHKSSRPASTRSSTS